MTPQALFEDWLGAVAENRQMTATVRADMLLDEMNAGREPQWGPRDRRLFLNWCDRAGLLTKGTHGQGHAEPDYPSRGKAPRD